ncbi:MAG TPA: hypothetical protein VFQ40_04810 [Actinomycetota bacterium]|nr:hypothetical protein [Actinomycetota bacterium]
MRYVSDHLWTLLWDDEHWLVKCEDPCPEDEQMEGNRACTCAMDLTEEPNLEITVKLEHVRFRHELDVTPDTPAGPAEVVYSMYVAEEGKVVRLD